MSEVLTASVLLLLVLITWVHVLHNESVQGGHASWVCVKAFVKVEIEFRARAIKVD